MFAASYSHTQRGIEARHRKASADPEIIEQRRRYEELRRQEAEERERAANRREMAEMAARLARLERIEAKRKEELATARKLIEAEGLQPRSPQMVRIAMRICKATGYALADVKSDRRKQDVVLIRQAIMYWIARLSGKSLPEIGGYLGGRDHTTVLHGIRNYPLKRKRAGRYLRLLDTSGRQHEDGG